MKPDSFPDLRYSFFCGEALPLSLAKEWQMAAVNSTVINLYGPTEATIAITSWTLDDQYTDSGNAPIGESFSGQEAIVVDHQNELVSNNSAGELWLGGSQVTDGYWQNIERTSQSFVVRRFNDYKSERWYKNR